MHPCFVMMLVKYNVINKKKTFSQIPTAYLQFDSQMTLTLKDYFDGGCIVIIPAFYAGGHS